MGFDQDFSKKWAPDELKFFTDNGEEKLKLAKKLYKERCQKVTLRKSIYPGRPPTYFFRYPDTILEMYSKINMAPVKVDDLPILEAELNKPGRNSTFKVGIQLIFPNDKDLAKLPVNSLLSIYSAPLAKVARVYSTMKELMKTNGFILSKAQKYNLCWGFSKHRAQIKYLTPFQRFSHFQGCWQLGRKDFLWQNIQKKRSKFPHLLTFMPLTYCLKTEYQEYLLNKHHSEYWIVKPVDAARGEGIYVVTCKEEVKQQKDLLVSQYIASPHLIKGHKYDLRVYVLVTSLDPLKIYVYKDGLVRFCSMPYELNGDTVGNIYTHLTNFSLNKKNPTFRNNHEDFEGEVKNAGSMKWRYSDIWNYFRQQGQDFGIIYDRICDLVTKTLLAVDDKFCHPPNTVPCHRNNAFELFGFDILLDEQLKPWLIEVNVGPSMNQDSVIDKMVKIPLLTDMLNLVGVRPVRRSKDDVDALAKGWPLPGMRIENDSPLTAAEATSLGPSNYQEVLDADNYSVLFDLDEEYNRRGNFVRVFPDANKPMEYLDMRDNKKPSDYLVRRHLELCSQGFNMLDDVCKKHLGLP